MTSPIETRRESMSGAELASVDEFSEEEWALVDEVIERYKGKSGSLIPVLEEAQAVTGYLPESVQRHVARGLDVPLSQVYGVVTFYSFFTMKPRGKHQIRICLGTACHVRGAKRNVDQLKKSLGIDVGECTEDRKFGLEVVRCLGACGLAPVMIMDEKTHKQVKQSQVKQILKQVD